MSSFAPQPEAAPSAPEPAALAEAPPPPQRCPNCEALAPGKYCAECGQKQGELRPTIRELLKDFSRYLLRLDSRLLRTLLKLVWPGQLTLEYLRGRRERYERPFRLFIIINVVYFLVMALLAPPRSREDSPPTRSPPQAVDAQGKSNVPQLFPTRPPEDPELHTNTLKGRLLRHLNERMERYNQWGADKLFWNFQNALTRYGANLSMLLAPASAAIFMLLYRRRDFRYAEHFVFCLHFLCFTRLGTILALLLGTAELLILSSVVDMGYLLLAMRDVYRASWWGTLWRWALGWVLLISCQALVLATVLLYVLLWQ